MRIALVVATAAVVTGAVLFGLRWVGLLSHEAAVVGFVTGIAVAAVLMIGSARKRHNS